MAAPNFKSSGVFSGSGNYNYECVYDDTNYGTNTFEAHCFQVGGIASSTYATSSAQGGSYSRRCTEIMDPKTLITTTYCYNPILAQIGIYLWGALFIGIVALVIRILRKK